MQIFHKNFVLLKLGGGISNFFRWKVAHRGQFGYSEKKLEKKRI